MLGNSLGMASILPRGAVVGWRYRTDLSATVDEPCVSFSWIGKDLPEALVIEVKTGIFWILISLTKKDKNKNDNNANYDDDKD